MTAFSLWGEAGLNVLTAKLNYAALCRKFIFDLTDVLQRPLDEIGHMLIVQFFRLLFHNLDQIARIVKRQQDIPQGFMIAAGNIALERFVIRHGC